MFIFIAYKDPPELSSRRRSSNESVDTSVEKSLLVNPDCPVRIMLEYIRKKCRLGSFTQFDLCDESGILKGLFALDTYAYATDQFEHKKIYYVIVTKQELDNRYTVLPQVNQENRLYYELQMKVKLYMENESILGGKSIPSLQGKVSPLKIGTPPSKGTVKSATPPSKGTVKRK